MSGELEMLPSTEADNERVGTLLNEHSAGAGAEFVEYNYHVEREGVLVAGITAWAMGPDLHIDMLAVAGSERRTGLGSRLLAHVENLAKADGCTTASVDTFSFQAPDFYPRHGYQPIFRYPLTDGTERIYFSKQL